MCSVCISNVISLCAMQDISLEPSECGDLKLGANRSSSCESSVCQEGHGFPSESSVGSLADLNNSEELWPCRASRAQLPPTSIDDAVDYDASCHLVPLMEPQKNDKKRCVSHVHGRAQVPITR